MKKPHYLTKRNVLLALLGLVTIALTIYSYLPKTTGAPLTELETADGTATTADSFSFLPAPEPQALNNIQVQQLESDGVELEKLYPNNPTAELRSDTTISSTNDYSILFLAQDLLFQITLYTQPFAETQTTAEQDLLEKLEITQDQACKLNVAILNQPSDFAQPATTTEKLSFCP